MKAENLTGVERKEKMEVEGFGIVDFKEKQIL
jgi:hypothetical protein